ncbi:DNA polymerase-3 subunit epsilon [Haloferula luteola]|uniref:DNA polymerase-3 subunit epsilon n=1 Tax=Haloferula luteola TaxID=595692 RepID=A0A840VCG6_9BACT|nr:3'-5' exonuclease [Haloferula luteola]MBB5353234.1 DNA polymerase-3 subunit epsilon [Haloferula luteola]
MKWPFFQHPEPEVARYLAGTPRRLSRNTPFSELSFLVLDAETTGFNLSTDRLLSVAAMPVRHGRAEAGGLRSWLFHQPDVAITAATRIHTILPSDSVGGTPERQVLQELLPAATGALIVGHHIGFDIGMLNAAMRRHFHTPLRNRTLDTALLSMRVLDAFRRTGYSNQRPPGLDEVCAHLGLSIWERHTADGDTFATAQIFLLLCARLRRKLGRDLVLGDLPFN